MSGHRVRLVAVLLGTMLLAACGGNSGVTVLPAAVRAPAVAPATPAPPPPPTTCDTVPVHDAGTFADPTTIDNRYLPLAPGQRLVLDGKAIDNGRSLPHRIETTATNLTKVIDGVRTLVVYEVDYEDGVLQESEIYYQAQDRTGAVWLFGEYPEEYSDGNLEGAPSAWIEGVAGGRAGIAMPATPRTGTGTYLQGLGPAVGFKDCGSVIATGQHLCAAGGRCFDDVVTVDEYAPAEPGRHQHKLVAPGVGTVRVAHGTTDDLEALELTSTTRLCGAALQRIDDATVAQDRRSFSVSAAIFRETAPVEATLPLPAC